MENKGGDIWSVLLLCEEKSLYIYWYFQLCIYGTVSVCVHLRASECLGP